VGLNRLTKPLRSAPRAPLAAGRARFAAGRVRFAAGRSEAKLIWLVSIVLVAANLRPVIASVPPLVDRLVAQFGLSSVAAGALTTLPVVCMGLFAPTAALAARRIGETAVLGCAVGLIAVGAAVRAFGGLLGLYGGTALAGIGIAVAGTLLPVLVRSRAADRVGPVTGIYTATLIFGALVASGATEPLREALGWAPQTVLAVWSLPALAALAVWLLTQRRAASAVSVSAVSVPAASESAASVPVVAAVASPWRSRAAWLGTLFMGAQSLLFYSTLAWLAARNTSLGMSAQHAGLLLAVFSATQVVNALAMPVLAHRSGNIRPWIAVSVGLTTLGLALVAVAPSVSPVAPWAWAAILGFGMGGNLSLALTVVTQAAPSPAAASAYSGMAFFVGYLLAAVGPVAAGALRDATGGFTAVFGALAVLGLLTLVVGLAAGSPDPRRGLSRR
jgi:CP family cyanate transporter-like MFS transporter